MRGTGPAAIPTPAETDRPAADPRPIILYLASMLTVMAGGLVAPALTLLEQDLGQGEASGSLAVRAVLTLPALFTALSAVALALLSDRFGKRRMLMAALLLYACAGVAGALATELRYLLATRALLGVAVGGLMTATVGIIADCFEGERRMTVLGRQAAFMGGGGIVFLAIGGALALVSWRVPFLLYALALPLVPLAWRWLPPDRQPRAARHRVQLAAGPIRMIAILVLCAFAAMAGFYLTPTMAPFLLAQLGNGSPLVAGGLIALASTASAAASASYATLRRRLAPMPIFALSFAVMSGGYAVVWAAGSVPAVAAGLMLFGGGLGMMLPNLGGWVADTLEEDHRAKMIGLVTMALFLGQFVSPILAEPIVRQGGVGAAFGAAALLLLAICLVLAAIGAPPLAGVRPDTLRQW